MVKPIPVLFSVAIIVSTAGCASLTLPFVGGKPDVVRPTPTNPVMDVLTIWQPGEGRGLDNLPSRGLAGQLMFFTYRKAEPALVEGDVTLYLFDDLGSESEQGRPIWQRTFTAEEWNTFAMQTSLGTAYQLFVPYVRKGQHEAHCSVRVKFEPADGGPPIYSKMANITLPGPKSPKTVSTIRRSQIESKPYNPSLVHRMGSLPEGTPAAARELETTTLSLPTQRRTSVQSNARLQQLAHEMVRKQEQGAIQQAAYETDPVDSGEADIAAEPDGGRYRLYR